MTDQLDFEMRLGAAIKAMAADADGPVDAARIATSALKASRRASWWTRIASIGEPQTEGHTGIGLRPLLITTLAIVALASISFGIYWLRGTTVGPPVSPPTPSASSSGSVPTPSAATSSAPSVETTPAGWSGPRHPDAAAMPVMVMDGPALCIAAGPIRWEDGPDAEAGFVDILEAGRSRNLARASWGLTLAAKPTPAADLDPNAALIEYGLVLDTSRDGTPDYEIGINNSPGDGKYRVWVTDLERDETAEQIGPPYGSPIEFIHPDEQEVDESGGASMSFWFLGGSPALVDLPNDYRYYAWSSYSENGSVVTWDYAPDYGWLELPACESLPVHGWPSTGRNEPGMYSWDGSPCGRSCVIGFMHNGNGSGDVEIRVDAVPDGDVADPT